MTQLPARPRVLLVEDSDDDVFFFSRALKAAAVACDLVRVGDGASAVRHFDEVRSGAQPCPDIVFLDLKLPIMSGFEVLERLRASELAPAPHVVVLSGSEQISDIARANALGVAAYCVKPVSAEQLKTRFHAWCERAPSPPA